MRNRLSIKLTQFSTKNDNGQLNLNSEMWHEDACTLEEVRSHLATMSGAEGGANAVVILESIAIIMGIVTIALGIIGFDGGKQHARAVLGAK